MNGTSSPPAIPSTSELVVFKQIVQSPQFTLWVVDDDGVQQSDSERVRVDHELDELFAGYIPADSGSEVDDEDDKEAAEDLDEEVDVEEEEEEEEQVKDESDSDYVWSEDYATFLGKEEEFLGQPGPKIEGTTPLMIFTQFWDQTIVENIVQETNRYAWEYIASANEFTQLPPQSRVHAWVETTCAEIYRLMAVMILMGICVRGQISEYYASGQLQMPEFRKLMSKNRFLLLMRFLHFRDNRSIVSSESKKIAKIKPILDYLSIKFKSAYSPRKQLSIDESLLLWKGKLSWVQCIRSKAARFGIKTYELCEAESGYVFHIIIYTGKDTTAVKPISGFTNSSAKIVLKLMEEYLGKGHTLFMDSYYNSVRLCRFLKLHRTDVVGTLNRRRIGTPEEIQRLNERTVPRGAIISRHCGDVSVLSWKDVRLVTTVSTFHKNDAKPCRRVGQNIIKPEVISAYNKFMGGVDTKDQKLSSYLLERKRGFKWYIKVFRRLLNITILNSYIIYSKIDQNQKLSHREFRYRLAKELSDQYGTDVSIRIREQVNHNNSCARLNRNLNHHPAHVNVTGFRTNKKQLRFVRRRCAMCNNGHSNIQCTACKVFLCIGQCWSDYHTLEF